MDTLEKENEDLRKELSRVKEICEMISQNLCSSCTPSIKEKLGVKLAEYQDEEKAKLEEEKINCNKKKFIKKKNKRSRTKNKSNNDISEGKELESQTNSGENLEDPFKTPLPKETPGLTFSSNIPLNFFSIFLSITFVGCFMFVCFILDKDGADSLTNSEIRNLQEEHYDPLLNQSSNEFYDQSLHYDSDMIQFQRYNFFQKVESDYLVEPENETLQVFKPDDNQTEVNLKPSIEQKLYDMKTPKEDKEELDEIEEKNKKYNNIESVICDSSYIFSEDQKFLFGDDVNYLHLMVRANGAKLVNSSTKNYDEVAWSEVDFLPDDSNVIEVGCKVFSTSVHSLIH